MPCLNGYVWRSAFPRDYVCVVPAVRAQAAADNAAAISRIAPGGGAYGPYTCKQGYVWRQVVRDDYVCVLPAVRAQAAADNAQADSRAALLRIWASDWTPQQSSAPEFQINGDHFNFGQVVLTIYNSAGNVVWTNKNSPVTAASHPGHAGGSLFVRTYIPDCSQASGAPGTLYAIAYDMMSHRSSKDLPLGPDCYSPG